MRHRIRVLRARTLAWIGFVRLLVAIARGHVDEVWVGDSNAVMSGADRFPRLVIGSIEPRRWVWSLGPRLMFSVSRDGFPPLMHRMLRVLRRVRGHRNVLWIFSAGEIDLRCHLVPRLAEGAQLEFVRSYVDQVRSLVNEFDASHAAVSVPTPPAVDIVHTDGFPVVGTPEERLSAHRLMRQRILDETGTSGDSGGAVIHAFDATEWLSDEQGYYVAEYTEDGIHPNDAGRVAIRAAVADMRARLSL